MKAILTVVFYKTDGGNEPVRDWLKSLIREVRKAIGEDINIKNSRKTPQSELDTARRRLSEIRKE